MPRRGLAHAVDADMAGLDQFSRRGARLHHPRVPQPFVDALPLGRGLLLAPRELLLQRSELCEGRIGIDRTIALARVRARGVGTQRRPALAVTALVAVAAAIVAALVAIAAELALVAIAILVAVLALEAAVLVVAPFGTRRAFRTTFAALADVSAAIPATAV